MIKKCENTKKNIKTFSPVSIMSFFDVHFLQRMILEIMGEGQAIHDKLQQGNTHMVVKHHNQVKRIFYGFVHHYKKMKYVNNISLVMLAEEQFHKFLDLLSSIHTLIIECYPTIEFDLPDIDVQFHLDLAAQLKQIIVDKKTQLI